MNGDEQNLMNNNNANNINNMNQHIQEEDEEQNFEMENNINNINNINNHVIYEDDNEQDDLYMMELHKRLALMKNERKLAEKDSQLLYNRLRLLKNEEEKTWKKISETKKKTNDKMNYIMQMQQNILLKQEIKDRKDREILEQKQINQERKFMNRNKMQQNREEKLRQVNEEFKLLKMQKQYNTELRNYITEEEKNLNKARTDNIRRQHLMIEEKKKSLDIEKRNQMRLDLERKLMEEYKLKEEAQNKLLEYENQEMEVLKRIRTTTQVHKNMCEELENLKLDIVNKSLNQSASLNNFNNNNNANNNEARTSYNKNQYSTNKI